MGLKRVVTLSEIFYKEFFSMVMTKPIYHANDEGNCSNLTKLFSFAALITWMYLGNQKRTGIVNSILPLQSKKGWLPLLQ